MTPEKVLEVIALYEARLEADPGCDPRRMASDQGVTVLTLEDVRVLTNHILWMCRETKRMLTLEPSTWATDKPWAPSQATVEKAMRWLGFIQGCLLCLGVYTIDEMRVHNTMPSG